MAAIADQVREMCERVIELSRTYAILWVFMDPGNSKRFAGAIREHQDFFDAIASSLHQGFCVITFLLFDHDVKKRGNVKSLPVLINDVPSLNGDQKLRLSSIINSQKVLLKKYFTYRHKIYAHRDKAKSPWEIFAPGPKARVKREMEAVVRLARDTVCALAGASGVRKKAAMAQEIRRRENNARCDAIELMRSLEQHRQCNEK